MAEFNSAPYFPIDLKGLTALMALAPDADVRDRARAGHRPADRDRRALGTSGRADRRARPLLRAHAARRPLAGAVGIAGMLWGVGNYGRRFHALPQLALCLRDHGLVVPDELAEIACLASDGAQEWCFAQGQDRIAKLYHYKTRDYAMGSAAAYRWNEWGYQETVLHLRLGDNPDAQIWINHPGETIHSGYGRPSYWGGSGTLPRVHQYRGLAVMLFDCAAEQPDFTHAWFPRIAFDVVTVEARHRDRAEAGDGLARCQPTPLRAGRERPDRRQRACACRARRRPGSCGSATGAATARPMRFGADFARLRSGTTRRRRASSSTIRNTAR